MGFSEPCSKRNGTAGREEAAIKAPSLYFVMSRCCQTVSKAFYLLRPLLSRRNFVGLLIKSHMKNV